MSMRLFCVGLVAILAVQFSDVLIDWRPWWTTFFFLAATLAWFTISFAIRSRGASAMTTGHNNVFIGYTAGSNTVTGWHPRPGPTDLWGDVAPAPTGEPRAIVGIIGYRTVHSPIAPVTDFVTDPAVCGHGHSHKAPAWDCSCGYYAMSQEMARYYDPSSIVKVEAIGPVIIHEQGWRAERIRRAE